MWNNKFCRDWFFMGHVKWKFYEICFVCLSIFVFVLGFFSEIAHVSFLIFYMKLVLSNLKIDRTRFFQKMLFWNFRAKRAIRIFVPKGSKIGPKYSFPSFMKNRCMEFFYFLHEVKACVRYFSSFFYS